MGRGREKVGMSKNLRRSLPLWLGLLVVAVGAETLVVPAASAQPAVAQEPATNPELPTAPPEAGAEPEPAEPGDRAAQAAGGLNLSALVSQAQKSVVKITTEDREGRSAGIGSGFVIDPSGLIATNLHVIGEARPIWVHLPDGSRHGVVAVYASDTTFDLAIVRIDAAGLPVLPLASERQTAQLGQQVVAIGHPLGFEHSVVTGVISGRREINGSDMWQLAIPIEPGNSGGPLLDLAGNVQGIITLKSTVSDLVGFAVTVDYLRKLIAQPNPIPIERWKTIGRLDARRWESLFGARWQQRGGKILVENPGEGFGGRALLLWQGELPELPYEVAVSVKLDDESGAAGLVFFADGQHRHWGFYPSNGRLRLTSFEGPDVFAWQVLREESSAEYQRGSWNHLKVRLQSDKMQCFVNDKLVMESTDVRIHGAKVGLAKFRDTKAQFKQFAVGKGLTSGTPPADELAVIETETRQLPPLSEITDRQLAALAAKGESASQLLRERASALTAEARGLQRIADEIHVQGVCRELVRLLGTQPDSVETKAGVPAGGRSAEPLVEAAVKEPLPPLVDKLSVQVEGENLTRSDPISAAVEGPVDLLRAALQIARLDNEEVDVEAYVGRIDQWAGEIRDTISAADPPAADSPAADSSAAKLKALNRFLFDESGFHGSRTEYYDRANSHLDRVIDDREGLPITLSVLYLELGRRLGLTLEGVGLPGHFVVRHLPPDGDQQILDVFDRARVLSPDDVALLVRGATGNAVRAEHLRATDAPSIVTRILTNLIGAAERTQDSAAMLRYVEALVAIAPDDASAHGMRAVLRHQHGRQQAALEDLDWIIRRQPAGIDLDRIEQMRRAFAEPSGPYAK